MYRISNIKVPVHIQQTDELLKYALADKCRISVNQIKTIFIRKRSVDARKKDNIYYIYSIDAEISGKINIKKIKDIIQTPEEEYILPETGSVKLSHPPVIVGFGPAGLLCGLLLARRGFKPVILERGMDIDSRKAHVDCFWKTGILDPESNVQFGEGGAGAFSDGKLNTMVKDHRHRNLFVLKEFVKAGADESIAYINKPHIGTDKLSIIVKNIRKEIICLGGKVLFGSKMTDIRVFKDGSRQICINDREVLKTDILILAIGHSARDTFELVYNKGFQIEQKSFAIGLRVSHLQEMINRAQYGDLAKYLPAADYKLVHKCNDGRGVYSFCMCPGGFIVNSASEDGSICVNGMSYSDRGGKYANSAVVVTVTPDDFESNHPLSGVEFQRKYERSCYEVSGSYKVPLQKYKDFKSGTFEENEDIDICLKGAYVNADLNKLLPDYICRDIKEGIEAFGGKIKGFNGDDVILAGVETRTSSPVRIVRDPESLECNFSGIYSCGEGAGYAGGIMSAAMDGMKIAEKIISKYNYKED